MDVAKQPPAMSTWSLSILALVSLAAISTGCGGSVFSPASGDKDSGTQDAAAYDAPPADAGGSDGGGSTDVGVGDAAPWSPDCPATVPVAGSECGHESGLQCEYGDAWWSVSCDTVMECQSGAWAKFQPSYEQCTSEPGPNSTECPATFADVPQGACSQTGLRCEYPQGQCTCQVLLGGPVQIDGGSPDWQCVPGMGCPFPRPRLGVSCSSEGQSCTYEECSYGEICQGGIWQADEEGCAGAQGGP